MVEFNDINTKFKKIAVQENVQANVYAFPHNGKYWITAAGGKLMIWQDTVLVKIAPLVNNLEFPIALSADGNTVYSGFQRYSIDKDTLEFLSYLQSEIAGPTQIKRTVNADHIFWTEETQKVVIHTVFTPSKTLGRDFDYKGPKNRLIVLDGNSGKLLHVLKEGFFSGDIAQAGGVFFACGQDSVDIWNIDNGNHLSRLPVKGMLRQIAFNNDNTKMMLLSDSCVQVWNTGNWTLQKERKNQNDILQAEFHPTLPALLTSDKNNQINYLALDSDSREEDNIQFNGEIRTFAISPNGRLIVNLFSKNAFEIQIYEMGKTK